MFWFWLGLAGFGIMLGGGAIHMFSGNPRSKTVAKIMVIVGMAMAVISLTRI